MVSYGACLSLSDWPHLVGSSLGPSVVLQVALFLSLSGWMIHCSHFNQTPVRGMLAAPELLCLTVLSMWPWHLAYSAFWWRSGGSWFSFWSTWGNGESTSEAHISGWSGRGGEGGIHTIWKLAEIECTFYLLYAGDGFNDIMYIHSFNHQSNAEGDI